MRKNLPRRFIIFVTTKCNLCCKHCFFSSFLNNQYPDITPEDIKKIFANYPRRLENVIFTGGEPFLNKSLSEIILSTPSKTINVVTNGYCPALIIETTEKILNRLKRIDSIGICVSLDGPEDVHNRIRGMENSYKKALETYSRLKELERKYPRLTVGLGAAISDINVGYLEAMAKAAWDKGEEFAFQLVRSVNQSGLPMHLRNAIFLPDERSILPDGFIDKIRSQLPLIQKIYLKNFLLAIKHKKSNILKSAINHVVSLGLLKVILMTIKYKKRILPCKAGFDTAVIYPNLDVALCEFMRPFSNLGDYNFDLSSLLLSNNAGRLRKIVKRCFCAHTCFVNFNKYDVRRLTAALWKI